ncbi:tRNA guanosine(34) transglycosylase Tgt [Novipirellula artificiosorum]|uniref:Queuine tRNA-ribosyltransferase n=1 Tax=Novipirellula artificiosorum TaxID=2528016 RepID=A0A5C6DH86_9BACT|nr:tRNA guanosine(34) transglycosylase Tgt [Novipirellula artificiosorum]TWU35952.1 Queuine tRNA-ribosyltransferase [Novipirellula artificiosorum]
MTHFHFSLRHHDAGTAARRGEFSTPHGTVQTPGFMPVGTQGTVKGVTIDQVAASGAEMILGNTYHLALRPGHQTVRRLGGLHGMTGWKGPILTDSGGFQVFSLEAIREINEEAATFRSHIDGAIIRLTPEHSIEIQESLGSDVAMVLDHVVALPAERHEVIDAMERSIRWARRCLDAATREDQARFAIVQGGLDVELRQQCASELSSMDFEGFAIGGLSVGEPPPEMYRITEATCPYLPAEKPRYLMGVGTPVDLLESVARGVDLFDCVMPTRNGRNAMAFTDQGKIKIRNAVHREDIRPLEASCPCLACRHSRGYLRHLFVAKEMLGPILLSIHNLTYYQRLMAGVREAIEQDLLGEFIASKKAGWASSPSSS